MTKPTREEVIGLDARLRRYLHMPYGEGAEIRRVFDAYLAQEEELVNERLRHKQEYWEQREIIDRLEVENQALKAFIKNTHVTIATPFFDGNPSKESQP